MINGKTISIVAISNIRKKETIDSIINCSKRFPFFDEKIGFGDGRVQGTFQSEHAHWRGRPRKSKDD